MTRQPSWPPPRAALKDSSANLMILQRPGLQSAARRRSLDTRTLADLSPRRLGRNVSEEVTVKVLHFSFHSPSPLFPTCKSNDRVPMLNRHVFFSFLFFSLKREFLSFEFSFEFNVSSLLLNDILLLARLGVVVLTRLRSREHKIR